MCDGCEVNPKYYAYKITEPTKEDILLESLCVPTQAEIRKQLGPKLAEVFFEDLSGEGRVRLGLLPPLLGPAELWITPASRLKNNVRCKPVPEPQVLYQKSFTHHSILELGEEYIVKLRNKMEQETQEALRRQALELEEEFKVKLKNLSNEQRENDECTQIVGTLMEHFDKCFNELAENTKLKMRKECQIKVREEREELAAYMLYQLQEEVARKDRELCSDFHETLYGELNSLARKYVRQIDSERKVAQEVVEEVIRKYETELVNLKAEMETHNLVDVCRAITEERLKMKNEMLNSEALMSGSLKEMKDMIEALQARNKTLEQMATERAKRIQHYEVKMKKLIEEFQKFINFALKATPAHAEFLLSTQKMILSNFFEDKFLNPEDYEQFKKCIRGKEAEEGKTEMKVEEEGDEADYFDDDDDVEVCSVEPEEPPADPLMKCLRGKECPYTFNYYRFKYNLLKKVKGVCFESPEERKFRKDKKPCTKPRVQTPAEVHGEDDEEEEELEGEHSVEELQQYKETLTVVGEKAREHLHPVNTFLRRRMKSISNMCRRDPELVKMMLGYQCGPELEARVKPAGDKKPVSKCIPGPSNLPKPC